MDTTELWNKLEADRLTDIEWLTEYEGKNSYEEFRDAVMKRLRDGDSLETAQKVFEEEFDKRG